MKDNFDSKPINYQSVNIRQPVKGPRLNDAFWKWFGRSVVKDKQGNPLVVYHSSENSFDQFIPSRRNDIGSHFGDYTQAHKIATGADVGKEYSSFDSAESDRVSATDRSYGKNFYAVYLSIQDPLRMKDPTVWDIDSMEEFLVEKGILSQVFADKLRALSNKAYDTADKEIANRVKTALVGAIKAKGYDGIIYANRAEVSDEDFDGASSIASWNLTDSEFMEKYKSSKYSYCVFDANQIKSVNNLGTWSPGSDKMMETLDSSLDDVEVYTNKQPGKDKFTLIYKMYAIVVEFAYKNDYMEIGFWDKGSRNGDEYALTDRGGDLSLMFKVFTFIAKKLPIFIKEHPELTTISFSARKESSRIPLYKRLANKLATSLGWSVFEEPSTHGKQYSIYKEQTKKLKEKMLSTEFFFGFELEAYTDDSPTYKVKTTLKYVKAMDFWGEIHQDDSIEPEDPTQIPYEFVSVPIPFSVANIQKMQDFLMQGVNTGVIQTNETCGFHIHLSWKYMTLESVIWALVSIAGNDQAYNTFTQMSTGGKHPLQFTSDSQANTNFLDKVRYWLSSETDIEWLIHNIANEADNYKQSVLRIHPQGTLEWRGPRNFLTNGARIEMFTKHFYKSVLTLIKAIEAPKIETNTIQPLTKQLFLDSYTKAHYGQKPQFDAKNTQNLFDKKKTN